MNICLVSRELYPFQKAGIAVYVYNLANALANNDDKVFIVTDINNSGNVFSNKNIKIINIVSIKNLHINYFSNFNLLYSYSVYTTLQEVVEHYKIDIIQFSDYFAEGYFTILYKKVLKQFINIPLLVKLHTPLYECREIENYEPIEDEYVIQEDFCIRNADFVSSISQAMKLRVEKRLSIEDIDVVYNILGFSNDYIETVESEKLIPDKYILFVGRQEYRKGIDLFIKACIEVFKKHSEYRAIIIGKDNQENEAWKKTIFSGMQNAERSKFIFLSDLSREALCEYYKKAYVSVFPSRWEGFGNICVEAMANGSPVIVGNKGGMMEIIQNGKYGLFCNTDDENDIYNKICYIIENPKMRNSYSARASKGAYCFSDQILLNMQNEYYNKVVREYKYDSRVLLVDKDINILFNLFNNVHNLNMDYYKEIERVTNEWELLKQQINELRSGYDSLVSINESQKDELTTLKSDYAEIVEKYEKKCDDYYKEIVRVTSEWELLKRQINELQSSHDSMVATNEIQKEELLTFKNDYKEIVNKYEKKYEETESIKKEYQKSIVEIEEYNKIIEIKDVKIEELIRVIRNIKEKLSSNKEKVAALVKTVEEYSENLKAAIREKENLENKLNVMIKNANDDIWLLKQLILRKKVD